MSEGTRAALMAAAHKISTLKKQVEALESAAERAEDAAAAATAELAEHSGLEKQLTAWRVSQLKKGAPTKTLPQNLQAKVDGKRAAEEELEQSQSAQVAIDEELRELRAKLALSESDGVQCAVAALHAIGDGLATELSRVNERRGELLQLLYGLSRVTIQRAGRPPEQIGLNSFAHDTLDPESVFASIPNMVLIPEDEIANRWESRLKVILADPEAIVAAPKPLSPSDYIPGDPQRFQGVGIQWLPGTLGSWKPEQA